MIDVLYLVSNHVLTVCEGVGPSTWVVLALCTIGVYHLGTR